MAESLGFFDLDKGWWVKLGQFQTIVFTYGFFFVLVSLMKNIIRNFNNNNYLTIIPRARMGYWLRGHESERNNCFSKIQLVGKKYQDKTTLAS